MPAIEFKNVYKTYPNGTAALTDFSLSVESGEFVVLLGPPGAGKSVILRVLAGLEAVSDGELLIGGAPAPPGTRARDAAMVFQDYGQMPGKSVYGNLAYGLKLRRVAPGEIAARVQEAAEALGLQPFLYKKPKKLTAEQKCRAALARVIMRRPALFLLNEPLGGLSENERAALREEILRLHHRYPATAFIYATSDPAEAMAYGVKIAVIHNGSVLERGTPQALYDNPQNVFTASFLGAPPMNFFSAKVLREKESVYAAFGKNKIVIPGADADKLARGGYIGKEALLGIRPEDMYADEVSISQPHESVIEADVVSAEPLGGETILYIKVDGKESYAAVKIENYKLQITNTDKERETAGADLQTGSRIKLRLDSARLHFFDSDTWKRI